MSNNVKFGDGVLDEVTVHVNSRISVLTKIAVDVFCDYLEGKVKDVDLSEVVKLLRNSPETEQKIVALWSEHLFEQELIPKGYRGLPDKLLIENFRREGYSEGIFVGYILAMMALADNDVPKDIILAVRDYIRPNLAGHHYNDIDELISQYKSEKYSWIEKTKNESD